MGLLLLFGGGGGGGGGPTVEAGLSRVRDRLRLQLVRRLGDAGGPRADDVDAEIDNLIAWAQSSLRYIHHDVSEAGNTGGGLDTLHTYTLDTPNRLTTNGDYLKVKYAGFYSTTADQKQLALFFDSQPYNDTGLRDADEPGINLGWEAEVVIIRLSATTVRAVSRITAQFFGVDGAGAAFTVGGGFEIVKNIDLTVADLGSNAIPMVVQGQGTADDDVVQNLSIIELRQQ